MTIEELHSAVLEAFNRQDSITSLRLLEPFLETAVGEERGRALSLKADVILCEARRAPEGLALVDEALTLLRDNPERTLRTLVTALGLCGSMGDVDRAGRYEEAALRLLQDFADKPGVAENRFRLYINLGLLANLRGHYPTGYWHLVQASACMSASDLPEGAVSQWRVWIFVHIADTCIMMGRIPEAAEALDKARSLITNDRELIRWTIRRAQVLRYLKRYREALVSLESLGAPESEWPAEERARYHLERGLVAQDIGDLRGFHTHLSLARQEAEEHCLEFLLCEIQRTLREPITAGVVQ